MTARPPPEVLRSFGLRAAPVAVAGGQRTTWRCGGVALKPAVPEESEWVAETLAALPVPDEVRVPRPVPAAGGWTSGGWAAWTWVDGEPDRHRVTDVVRAGEAFAALLADVPAPAFLATRDDPWHAAARAAWQESALPSSGAYADLVAVLAPLLRPLDLPARLMHPDLAGNVLFREGMAPAVIDWPPFLRPVAWGAAVVAVDVADTDARADVLGLRSGHEWHQLLLRAEIYRLCVKNEAERRGVPIVDDKVHHRATVALLTGAT